MTEPLTGPGSLQRLGDLLGALEARRVFVIASASVLKDGYAGPILETALRGRDSTVYSGYGKGPELREVVSGAARLKEFGPDAIVAIGGGTPIDFAKLVNVFAANADPFAGISAMSAPLVAVPTTCGTGSEATPFAVIYKDRIKHSLESAACMLPGHSILDPELLRNLPPRQIACTGLDAASQAVESWWSVNSTAVSREFSAAALGLVRRHFREAWRERSPEALEGMLLAAHNSGKAIAIARTTASHALSYPLTAFHGVPHGHAVALTLGEVLVHNAGVTEDSSWDPRGAGHVRAAMAGIISALGAGDAEDARSVIKGYMRDMGLEIRLRDLGVQEERDVDFLLSNGVNPDRLRNNPRRLDAADLKSILMNIL